MEADRDARLKELESLGHELTGLRSEIASTGENHSLATSQLTTALQERENILTKVKQDHEATREAYEHKLAEVQSACKELEEKSGRLESELNQSKRTWELDEQKSQQKLDKLDTTIAEQRSAIGELQQLLEKANSQASKHKTDLDHAHTEKQELSHAVTEHTANLAKCRQDINRLKEQISSLQANLEAANSDLSETKNSLLTLSKEGEERESRLKTEMESTLSALAEARSEISTLTAQLSEARQADAAQKTANVQKEGSQADQENVIKQLQAQIEDSESRLSRQLDAFNTIRGELTTVRERQLDREDEIEQRMQIQINELEESLNEAFEKRKMAEDKLQQAGLSPVSERGFWVSDDGMSDSEGSENNEDSNSIEEPIDQHRSPMLGRRPPLQKPRFSEFHHVPQCNGCLSEAFDV